MQNRLGDGINNKLANYDIGDNGFNQNDWQATGGAIVYTEEEARDPNPKDAYDHRGPLIVPFFPTYCQE